MEKRLYGAIASSQDPTQVANKVKGMILAFSSLIILIAAHVFNVNMTADDVVMLAGQIGTISGMVWAIYGALLHIVTWLGTVKDSE